MDRSWAKAETFLNVALHIGQHRAQKWCSEHGFYSSYRCVSLANFLQYRHKIQRERSKYRRGKTLVRHSSHLRCDRFREVFLSVDGDVIESAKILGVSARDVSYAIDRFGMREEYRRLRALRSRVRQSIVFVEAE